MHKLSLFILIGLALSMVIACEKEIEVSIPNSREQLVVEASINQFSPLLNYVFITKSLDYFKPDLTLGGVDQALVTVTEGRVSGRDTIYDGTVTRFFNLYDIPGSDTLFTNFDSITRNLRGIYLNPTFVGVEGRPYRLDITLTDGRKVTGKTYIPMSIPIDTVKYEFRGNPDDSGRVDAFVSFFWNDPAEQNNYRLFLNNQFTSVLLGWGAADIERTFDDELLNGQYRVYSFFRPFKQNDTINIFLCSIGRPEFLFWQSYDRADNSGNPFSTPVLLQSNLEGAIGTFTGYGVSFRQTILR